MAVIAYADTKVRAVGLAEYKRDMNGAQAAFGGFAKAVLVSAGAVGLAVGKIGIGFQDSMATVKGVMKPTEVEFANLTAAAREMGETTEKSASQSADALKFLGMAGMGAAEAIKVLPGMVDLSTAGAVDLAMAADIATDSLTALGLGADQMTRLGDVMVATITSSNTTIEMMGETFAKVAPVASAYGISLEELSVHTGILANAGIKAGVAGISLKNAYINNAKAAKVLGTENQGLIATLTAAKKAQWDVNEITEHYGKIALPGVLNLMKSIGGTGPGSYENMSVKIRDNKGALKDLAATMRDTLGGSIQSLMATLEGFALDLFNVFGDDAKSAVDGAVKALRNYREEILLVVQALVPLVKIVGVGGLLLLGLKAAPPLIAAATFAFTAMRNAMFAIAAGNSIWTVLNTQLYGVSVSATLASGALGKVKVAGGLLFALFAGWEIGGWLRKWGFIEDTALNVMGTLNEAWIMAGAVAERAWFHIQDTFAVAMKVMFKVLESFGEAAGKIADFLGFDGMADSMNRVKESMKAAGAETKGYAGSLMEINQREMAALSLNDKIIADMHTDIKLTGDIITKKGELGTTSGKVANKIADDQAKQLAAIKASHGQYLENAASAEQMAAANDAINASVEKTGKIVAKTSDQWEKHWASQWQNIAKYIQLGEAVPDDPWIKSMGLGEKDMKAAAEAKKALLESYVAAGKDVAMDPWATKERSAGAMEERNVKAMDELFAARAEQNKADAEAAGMYAENAAYAFFDVFEDEMGRVGQAIEQDFGQVFGNLVQGLSLAKSSGGEFQIGEFVKANREGLANMAYSVSKLFRDQDAVQTKTQVQLDKVAEFASNLGWIGSLVGAGWNAGRGMTEHSEGGIYMNGELVDVGDISTGDYAADPAVAYAGQQIMGDQYRSAGQQFSASIQTGDAGKTAQYTPGMIGEWTDPAGALFSESYSKELGDTGGAMLAAISGHVWEGIDIASKKLFGEDAMPEFNMANLTDLMGGSGYDGSAMNLVSKGGGVEMLDESAMKVHEKDWYNTIQSSLVVGFNSVREKFNNKSYMLLKDLPEAYADQLESFYQLADFTTEEIIKNEYYGIDEAGERVRKTVAAYGTKLDKIMTDGTVKVVGDYIRNAEGLGDLYRPEAAEALASQKFEQFDSQGKSDGTKDAFESVTEAYEIYQGLVSGFEDIQESLLFGEDAATEYAATMENMGVVHENQIKWLEQMGFSEKALTETMRDQAAMAEHVRQQFEDARGDILTSLAIPEKLGAAAMIINDVTAGFENAGEALRNLGATQQDLEQLEILRLENIKWKIGEVADSILGKFTNVREMLAEKAFVAAGGTQSEFTMNQLQEQMAANVQTFESLGTASSLLTEWVQQAESGTSLGDLTGTFENLAGQIEAQTAYVAERETIGAAGLDWDTIEANWQDFFSMGAGAVAENASGRYQIGMGGDTGQYTAASGSQYSFSRDEGAAGLAAKSEEYEAILRENYAVPSFSGGGIISGPDSGYRMNAEFHGTERIQPLGSGGMTEGETKLIAAVNQLVALTESGQNISIRIEGKEGGDYADNVRNDVTDGREYLL